jgi:hypothetical protein
MLSTNLRFGHIPLSNRAKSKAGRILREEASTSLDREPTRRPPRSPKLPCRAPRVKRHEEGTMARRTKSPEPPPPLIGSWIIQKRTRSWEVFDPAGQLVCITLYKRGAEEVVRRLST